MLRDGGREARLASEWRSESRSWSLAGDSGVGVCCVVVATDHWPVLNESRYWLLYCEIGECRFSEGRFEEVLVKCWMG